MQQTIIITGASSGFGLATAELLATKGHRVYGLCRRPMEHGKIHYMQCDVRNREQVAESAQWKAGCNPPAQASFRFCIFRFCNFRNNTLCGLGRNFLL